MHCPSLSRLVLNRLPSDWHGPGLRIYDHQNRLLLTRGDMASAVALTFKNPAFWRRAATHGISLAFGEGYEKADVLVQGDLLDLLQSFYLNRIKPDGLVLRLLRRIQRTNVASSVRNAAQPYDSIDEGFYRLWLDSTLGYTCGYFPQGDEDSYTGQMNKADQVCVKLGIKPRDRILDIGCGWGLLLKHAVEQYGAEHALGLTVAPKQVRHINHHLVVTCSRDKVYARNLPWQKAAGVLFGRYDAVAAVGCLEHVGRKNYRHFFNTCHSLVEPAGRVFIQTIGHSRSTPPDPWISTNVFPGGDLGSLAEITAAAEQAGLVVLDVENLRPHYARTLDFWLQKFQAAKDEIQAKYGGSLYCRFLLYLKGSLAGFLYGDLQLYQLVLGTPRTSLPWDERGRQLRKKSLAAAV